MIYPFILINLKSKSKLSRLLTSQTGCMTDLFSAQLYLGIWHTPNASTHYYGILLNSSFYLISRHITRSSWIYILATSIANISFTSIECLKADHGETTTKQRREYATQPSGIEDSWDGCEFISNLSDWQDIQAIHLHLNMVSESFLIYNIVMRDINDDEYISRQPWWWSVDSNLRNLQHGDNGVKTEV